MQRVAKVRAARAHAAEPAAVRVQKAGRNVAAGRQGYLDHKLAATHHVSIACQ